VSYGTGKAFNHMTILEGGSGQHAGKIGEMCFAQWLMANDIEFSWSACNKGPIDFSVFMDGRWIGIDVKAKERNVPPNWEHDAHVTVDQERYACHIYVFCNVTEDKPTLMGWCGKEEFWKMCRRVKKGDADGAFREHVDAGKLTYSQLRQMADLTKYA
jgi:hypothetical protein